MTSPASARTSAARGARCTMLITSVALAACSGVRTYDEPGGLVLYDAGAGGAPDGGIRPTLPVPSGEIAPVYGFVQPAARVEYYYFGEVDRAGPTVPANPIYFFYDETGAPLFRLSDDGSRLVGWHPVVNVIPTQHGYSPFWRVYHVRVKGEVDRARLDALRRLPPPAKTCQMDAVCAKTERCIEERCAAPIDVGIFPLDGVKSHATLMDSKLIVRRTNMVINCPVVDPDAKLLKGLSDPDLALPKVQLWYQRLKAFCYLVEGGRELLGQGPPALRLDERGDVQLGNAYFIRQRLTFGTEEAQLVLPAANLVLTEHLPASGSYTPLVREWSMLVGTEHEVDDVRSVAEAQAQGLKLLRTEKLHNLVVRGTIPACTTDQDCAGTGGKVDPPLKCSVEQGYCSPPFARFGEECRRGVKECDPKGGPAGTPLVCVGLRVRDKYFCFNACDSSVPDGNPDPETDTRCGSAGRTRCYSLRRTDPSRPNGVCIRKCNSRAGDRTALLAECTLPGCGDGKLDHGETCDDGNRQSGDGCNELCSLSTFERCDNNSDCRGAGQQCQEPVFGQQNTYCMPSPAEKDESVEDGKYRMTCMEFDYCWPPDERADWLGQKEDQP